MKKTICCVLAASGIMLSSLAEACTRVVFHGENNNVMTARSMDWKSDVGTNLWILPSGVKRTGQAGPQSASWTAKYGSVVATGYDISTTDGVNEAGLNANLLWLVESEYPQTGKSKKPKLSISLWAQYVLDNFSTKTFKNSLDNFPDLAVTFKTVEVNFKGVVTPTVIN